MVLVVQDDTEGGRGQTVQGYETQLHGQPLKVLSRERGMVQLGLLVGKLIHVTDGEQDLGEER